MSDRTKERNLRAAVAGGMLLAGALCTTAYYALRGAPGDAGAAHTASPSSSPAEASEQAANAAPAPPADPTEPQVTPADPQPSAAPKAGTRGANIPARHQPEEPKSEPAVEPAPSSQPSATASAATSAVAPPPPVATANKTNVESAVVGQFVSRVSPQFKLLGVDCVLDGRTVYSGPGGKSVELFRRTAGPGKHSVTVTARYQGNGGGVFSYFDGYKFTVKGGKEFPANADGPTRVTVTAMERGGKTAAFEDRLALAVQVQ